MPLPLFSLTFLRYSFRSYFTGIVGLGFSLSFGSSFLGGVFTTGFWPTAGLVGLDIEVVDGAGVDLVVEPEVAVVFVGAGGVGFAVVTPVAGFGADVVLAGVVGLVVDPEVAVVFVGAGGVGFAVVTPATGFGTDVVLAGVVGLVADPEVAVVFVGAGGVGLAVVTLVTGFGTDAVVAGGAGFAVEPAVAVVFAGAGGVDLTTIFGVTTGAPAGEAGGDGLARLPLPEFTEPLPELIDEPPALGLGRELTLIGFSRMVPLDPL